MSEKFWILAFLSSFFVPLVLSIPFWGRLIDRYNLGGIVCAFFIFGVALSSLTAIFWAATSQTEVKPFDGFYTAMSLLCLFSLICGLWTLKTSKHSVNKRQPDAISLAMQGRWDLLEQAGVPKREIEQLKQLTPEEISIMLAPLIKSKHDAVEEAIEKHFPGIKKKRAFEEDITIFPGSLCDDLECHPGFDR